jgi:transcriptional regulator
MYVPKHHAVEDRAELLAILKREPFGILISSVEDKPFATHLPFIVLEDAEQLTLGLHVAKANPQWRSIEGQDVLAIFHGPHAFVSAGWYEQPRESVPTWNYTAVHCTGRARIASDEQTARILERLVQQFEPQWRVENADAHYIARMRQAIVGIELAVTAIQGKFKDSPSSAPADRERVIAQLEASSRPMDRQVAGEMRARKR